MTGWDPYLDLATGVLRNRLGITDRAELARAEAELASFRIVDLRHEPIPGHYDLDHLRAFHRFIFGDVYDWAGEIRTIAIGKGELFCLPENIESEAAGIFGWLPDENYLRGYDHEAFVDALTELLSDINSLHPFREGNGRTQRAFLAQLAREAGHTLRWSAMKPAENVAAARAAHAGDLVPLRSLLARLVT